MHLKKNYPFLGWLLLAGLMAFGGYLLWDYDLVNQLISHDVTYLSSVILSIFLGVTIYLGRAAWRMSVQWRYARSLMGASGQGHLEDQSDSWVHEYLSLLASRRSIVAGDGDPLTARLIERVNRGHASGWFLSDLALRLGLIGTVIGFVLMLGSVYELEPGDVSALRELMATMGSGMRVALYTTLSGLGAALLISIQCKWLDHCADMLVSEAIRLGIDAE